MSCLAGILEEEFFDEEDENFTLPVEKRRQTDFGFVIAKVVFLLGLAGLFIYCLLFSNLFRFIHGYDTCGNVCGASNPSIPGLSCSGGDFTYKPFMKVSNYDLNRDIFSNRECVNSCSENRGYEQIFYTCIKTRDDGFSPRNLRSIYDEFDVDHSEVTMTETSNLDFEKVIEDLNTAWPTFMYLMVLALCLSGFFMVMNHYAASFMVWSSLSVIVILLTGITIFIWVMYGQMSNLGGSSVLIFAIVFTFITVIVTLVILVLRKRIRLVIQLFEEAGRAFSAMPLLFFQPLWTILSLIIAFCLWILLFVVIESAGLMTQEQGMVYYKQDAAMRITRIYNIFALIWISQFVIACQHMVIASAVSSWFFTRDKTSLKSPILTGYMNLVRYHLGSVIFGSLIMTIVSIIKKMAKFMERIFKRTNNFILRIVALCIRCFMSYVERFFNIFTRNAYIEIAIYGKPFCTSAVRGLNVLVTNLFNVIAVNYIGDYVLFMFKFIITLISGTVASVIFFNDKSINIPHIPVLVVLCFSYFIAHTFISVFEMIIDTIFICFCEDCKINDGINNPFFMSRGLMEFVEKSKKRLMKNAEADTTNPNAAIPLPTPPHLAYKFGSY